MKPTMRFEKERGAFVIRNGGEYVCEVRLRDSIPTWVAMPMAKSLAVTVLQALEQMNAKERKWF